VLICKRDGRTQEVGAAHVAAAQILAVTAAAVDFEESLAALDHGGIFFGALLAGDEAAGAFWRGGRGGCLGGRDGGC